MGKNKNSNSKKLKSDTKIKGLKVECCEKYLKKGEHKRCRRCPCFDMNQTERIKRFQDLEIKILPQDQNHK